VAQIGDLLVFLNTSLVASEKSDQNYWCAERE